MGYCGSGATFASFSEAFDKYGETPDLILSFRPDEEISTFIPPGAILARMTPSIILTMLGNKVLVELKRKLQEVYEK